MNNAAGFGDLMALHCGWLMTPSVMLLTTLDPVPDRIEV